MITKSSNRDERFVYLKHIRTKSLSQEELSELTQVIKFAHVDEVTSLIMYCADNGKQNVLDAIKMGREDYNYIVGEINKYRNKKKG